MSTRTEAGAVIDAALAHSGAPQTEVLYLARDDALTRFATNQVHQNVREHDADVQVRVIDGQRQGVASTNRLDADGIREVVERATAIAARSAPNPRVGELPGPNDAEFDPGLGYAEATASASADVRGEGARAMIAAGLDRRLEASGSFATGVMTVAVGNSHGLWAEATVTRASIVTVMMDGFASGAASGYATGGSIDVTTLDPEALGREAAEKADRMRGAGELEAGEYEVVLEEYAVAGLLEYLSYVGFSALAVEEGRSFMELGRTVTGEEISIWDDGTDASGMPLPIDFEGVARRRVSLIEHGVARSVVHDSATAQRAGVSSTGHGLPAPNPWGPQAQNIFMAPGAAARDDLLAGMSRGIWVTRFHYINPVHPKKAILTGMTKDGTFLVENGRFVRPILNFRFTQSVPEAFASVRAMTAETKLIPGEFLGAYRVPAMHLGSFNFTGVTAAEGPA